MSAGNRHWEQDKDSTVYIGNLDEQVTDALVWELMIQAGPVVNVHLPKDRVSQNHQSYGFVEFQSEEDAEYAIKLMNGVKMFSKPIRLNKASADKRTAEGGVAAPAGVGAELYIGNLDSLVDEKTLYDTFSRFGPLLAPPKVARDDSNLSKGYAFVSFASFASSDDAINNMHGQYLMNKEVVVQYAFKKDGKGERHGDAAERALAAQAIKNGVELQIPAMPAALVMPQQAMPAMPAMPNGYGMGGPLGPPQAMPYAYAPSPVQPSFQNPPRQYNQSPLQAPGASAGLPARPPQSNGGYGGPMMAPGMPAPPTGLPPSFLPPGPPPGSFPGR